MFNHLQQERETKISEIRQTLLNLKERDLVFDEKKFIQEIMGRYGCAERKAREYLKTAKFTIENEK